MLLAVLLSMIAFAVSYSGASFGTQIANIVGGGSAPFIMVARLAQTHTTASVALYVTAGAVASLLAVALIRLPGYTGEEPS